MPPQTRVQARKNYGPTRGPQPPTLYSTDLASKDHPIKMTKARQLQWLQRSQNWPDLPAIDWAFVKVLGGGSNGVVGQWRYIGPVGTGLPVMPANIAIKQSYGQEERIAMQWESRLLRQIMGVGSDHVVKLYKGYHLDGGTGTDPDRDPFPFDPDGNYDPEKEVCRMYLEFCAGGDLDMIEWVKTKRQFIISEEQLWRIMLCMFKALLVLEQGHETTPNPAWGRPIAHFDIKPANILIGERDAAGEHRRLEPMKLTDFGLSLKVPSTVAGQTAQAWLDHAEWRATLAYMSPEQYYRDHPNRLITTKSSIYGIAAALFTVVRNGIAVDLTRVFTHPNPFGAGTIAVSGYYREILKENRFHYSAALIDLFCACLAFNPGQRPSLAQLVTRAQTVVDAYELANAGVYAEPLKSGREPNVLPAGQNLQSFQYPPAGRTVLVNRTTVPAGHGGPGFNPPMIPNPNIPLIFDPPPGAATGPPAARPIPTLATYPVRPMRKPPRRRP